MTLLKTKKTCLLKTKKKKWWLISLSILLKSTTKRKNTNFWKVCLMRLTECHLINLRNKWSIRVAILNLQRIKVTSLVLSIWIWKRFWRYQFFRCFKRHLLNIGSRLCNSLGKVISYFFKRLTKTKICLSKDFSLNSKNSICRSWSKVFCTGRRFG